MGRVLGDDSEVAGQPGDTLVTSIDAKVQGIVERQLAETIKTARATHDDVTGRNYEADSGAVVVMEADTGRIVAMASQPTYDPSVWVGGISKKQLSTLYSERRRQPAPRPGDAGPVRAGLDVEAVQRGERARTTASRPTAGSTARRACRSATGGSRTTSRRPTAPSTSPRRCRSPATRSSTASASASGSATAPTRRTSTPGTRSSRARRSFGFGRETGIDLPGEAGGRIADRALEAVVLEVDEGLLLQDRRAERRDRASATSCTCSPTSSASRAATTGPATR